ncbi:MAG: hypothetical protein R3321_08780 [Nitrososphaeraceae archaeon]|nr:hypothetical protein [Nitrososphaeraceae archaeon]
MIKYFKIIFLLIVLLTSNNYQGYSQLYISGIYSWPGKESKIKPTEEGKVDIEYLELNDSLLLQVIDSFISHKSHNDSLFKEGYGIIGLVLSKVPNYKIDAIDTVLTMHFTVNYMHPHPDKNSMGSHYTRHYSIHNNRLIHFDHFSRMEIIMGVSLSSAKVYDKIAETYLKEEGHPSRDVLDLSGFKVHIIKDSKTKKALNPIYIIE